MSVPLTPTTKGLLDVPRLAIADVCRELGVSRCTVDRWCVHGLRGHRLRRVRIGGRVFVLRDDLDRWIADMSDPPTRETRDDDFARRAETAAAKCEALGL